MSVQEILVVLFFFIIPFGLMLLFVPKLFIGARHETNGCNNILLFLSTIIIFPLVLYIGSSLSPVIPKSLIFYLGLTVFLLEAGIYFGMIISGMRLNKEDILLDLGRGESRYYLLFGFSLFVLVVLLAFVMLQDEIDLDSLALAVMWLPACLRYLTLSLSKVYLTEDGIFRFEATLRWGYIRDYSWGKRKNNRQYLTIHTQIKTTISVPAEKQAKIDEIIRTRLGWHLRQDFSQGLAQV
jgi:hypothetical protein